MRRRILPIALLVLVAVAICLRLGVWQLSRWQEKRALNAGQRAGLAAGAIALGDRLPEGPEPARRVLSARGRWDLAREVLVAGGLLREVPVSRLVLPLVLAGGEAVLVDRGALPAEEAAVADLSRHADTGWVEVRGWAEPMRRGAGAPGPRALAPVPAAAGHVRLSARWLDADSLAPRFPYRIASFVLRELPGPDAPAGLAREAPPPLDETMHLGYAIQWFAIAAVILGGGIALAVRQRAA